MYSNSPKGSNSLQIDDIKHILDILETHHLIAMQDANYEYHRHYTNTVKAIDILKRSLGDEDSLNADYFESESIGAPWGHVELRQLNSFEEEH